MDVSSLPEPYWQGPVSASLLGFTSRAMRRRMGLDPYLVSALIRQESEFNPSAVSHSNALGLMQLLPRTGKGEAKKAGLSRYTRIPCSTPDSTLSWARTTSARWWITSAARSNTPSLPITRAIIVWKSGAAVRQLSRYRRIRRVHSLHRNPRIVQAIVRNAEVYKRV